MLSKTCRVMLNEVKHLAKLLAEPTERSFAGLMMTPSQ